jgi:hypothetical protein
MHFTCTSHARHHARLAFANRVLFCPLSIRNQDGPNRCSVFVSVPPTWPLPKGFAEKFQK